MSSDDSYRYLIFFKKYKNTEGLLTYAHNFGYNNSERNYEKRLK